MPLEQSLESRAIARPAPRSGREDVVSEVRTQQRHQK
jgi:hypothetical protein